MLRILQLDKNHPLIAEQLSVKGFVVEEDHTSGYDEVLEKIHGYSGIIIRSRIPLDRNFLAKAAHLKFIARVGAGMENIDVEAAAELGIMLINSPEGNRDAVAEHVLGGLLLLMNRLLIASAEVKNGIWLREENRGEELCGKTFGIIGYGNMGKAVAKRLAGFGCRVIFHDIRTGLQDGFAQQVTLQELQQQADIISLHVPLTPLTEYYIDEDFIRRVQKNFWLVNTARGRNVKTSAVAEAVQNGKIKGVFLDVVEYEKPSFEKLLAMPAELQLLLNSNRALITPHIAGWTHESKIKLAQVIADKILAAFA